MPDSDEGGSLNRGPPSVLASHAPSARLVTDVKLITPRGKIPRKTDAMSDISTAMPLIRASSLAAFLAARCGSARPVLDEQHHQGEDGEQTSDRRRGQRGAAVLVQPRPARAAHGTPPLRNWSCAVRAHQVLAAHQDLLEGPQSGKTSRVPYDYPLYPLTLPYIAARCVPFFWPLDSRPRVGCSDDGPCACLPLLPWRSVVQP